MKMIRHSLVFISILDKFADEIEMNAPITQDTGGRQCLKSPAVATKREKLKSVILSGSVQMSFGALQKFIPSTAAAKIGASRALITRTPQYRWLAVPVMVLQN